MFRIRFHGRGGQGIKTASRILGTAFFLEGLEVQDAPRYGAERRGAPIFAYVRAAREPILERGIIKNPDLVVVTDLSLLLMPSAGVLDGISQNTVILTSRGKLPGKLINPSGLKCTVLTLPPESVKGGADNPFYTSAECAGAAARISGIISRKSLEKAVCEEIGRLGEKAVENNLEKVLYAYDRMEAHAGCMAEIRSSQEENSAPAWIEIPYDHQDISSPAIFSPATSLNSQTGLWRLHRPVIDHDICNNCMLCAIFCPDNVIEKDDADNPRINYQYCKGCLICMTQCKVGAISSVYEAVIS